MNETAYGWTVLLQQHRLKAVAQTFVFIIPESVQRLLKSYRVCLLSSHGETLVVEAGVCGGLLTGTLRTQIDEDSYIYKTHLADIVCTKTGIENAVQVVNALEIHSTKKNTCDTWIIIFLKVFLTNPGEVDHIAFMKMRLEQPALRQYAKLADDLVGLLAFCGGSLHFSEAQEIRSGVQPISMRALACPTDQTELQQPFQRYEVAYKGRPVQRGHCVIVNNKTFDKNTGLSLREGTEKDAESLAACFTQFGFETHVHEDLCANEIEAKLKELAEKNFTEDDCFVCCILTHGKTGDELFGYDGNTISLEEVTALFRGDKCKSLLGKPKIFIIQACRGNSIEQGVALDSDGKKFPDYHIPTHADFLIAHSTLPGYVSIRDPKSGSWFVQTLCSVLQDMASYANLDEMIRVVCNKVGTFEGLVPTVKPRSYIPVKEMPWSISTLTHTVYFSTSPPA